MFQPKVSCLCPTYKRPELLANSLACFLAQDYPNKELIILDDGGTFYSQRKDSWELIQTYRRFNSLPGKYNALAEFSHGEILVVWEDDDIYLPWHISSIVKAINYPMNSWAHPEQVYSLYTGSLQKEDAKGRFHGSLAMTKDAWQFVGGWPLTKMLDFDQRLFAFLEKCCDEPARPEPGYVFRWASTKAYHGQAFDRGTWYRDVENIAHSDYIGRLEPQFDAETERIYQSFLESMRQVTPFFR